MHASSAPFDPILTTEKALEHERGWILLQKKWKSRQAFKKIEKTIGLDLLKLSGENLARLRREVVGSTPFKGTHLSSEKMNGPPPPLSSLSPQEELFFNLFCEKIDFTFTHGTSPANYSRLSYEKIIRSYDELRGKGNLAQGLSSATDVALGNTGMVYGILGTPGSKFPLLGCRRDAFIFNVSTLLKETAVKPFMTRLSDWFWFESERELDPCLLGTTLRRIIHCKMAHERIKIYIYEHQNGERESFMVRRGDEEFAGHSFVPAIALMMIKELRIIQKGDPAFYEQIFNQFSPQIDNSAEIQKQRKQVLTDLFHTLYSPESTVPTSLKLGMEGHDYFSSIGFSRKTNEIHTLYDFLKQGNLAGIKNVLEENPELIDAKMQGHTLLMKAAGAGNKEIVAFLLANRADPYEKASHDKMTALAFAILGSSVEVVELLLKHANKNVNDLIAPITNDKEAHRWKRYHTPLMLAGQVGNPAIIKLLLEAGARPRKQHVVIAIPMYQNKKDRFFLLGQKCYENKYGGLKAYGDMILPGCLKEEIVQDPLIAAQRNLQFLTSLDSENTLTSLVYSRDKLGDNPGIQYQTDFVLVDYQTTKPTPFSRGHILNLKWVDASSTTALEDAGIKPSNKIILNTLIASSVQLATDQLESHLYLETEGVDLLHQAIRKHDRKRMKWLINQSVPIEGKIGMYSVEQGYEGRYTPLMTAMAFDNQKAVKILLMSGANPNTALRKETVWDFALKNKNKAIMAQLLRTPSFSHCSLLQDLIKQDDKQTIKFVFQKIINVNSLNFDGTLPYFMRDDTQFLFEVFLARKPENKTFLFESACVAARHNQIKTLTALFPLLPDWSKHPTSFPYTTPLHEACQANATEVALMLIKLGGGNSLSTDPEHKTPLDYAKEENNKEIIDFITQTLPYQVMSKCGIQIKETYIYWVSFFNKEDAWAFYRLLRSEGYECNRPDLYLKVYISETTLSDFVNGIPAKDQLKQQATEEMFSYAKEIFKVTPIKIEKGYRSFNWELFFDSEVNVEELAKTYKQAFPLELQPEFCKEDNSIHLSHLTPLKRTLTAGKPIPSLSFQHKILGQHLPEKEVLSVDRIEKLSKEFSNIIDEISRIDNSQKNNF
jgi:ankyrin repeat protein